LAHAPRLCHALCVIRDIRVALHFRKNRDHHLVGSFSLELSKLLVKARCGFFRNNAGVIVEVTRRASAELLPPACAADREHNENAAIAGERTLLACWRKRAPTFVNFEHRQEIVWRAAKPARERVRSPEFALRCYRVHIMASLRAPERAS
jgi:hypothetical protein